MKNVDALFPPVSRGFYAFPRLPVPTTTCTKSLRVSVRPLSRIAFCRQPLSFVAHSCPLSPHVANCSLLSPSAEFICISESLLPYAYTTHDDVTLKIVAAQLWRNPEHFAQPEEATGKKRLPQNRIGPGARIDTEIARS